MMNELSAKLMTFLPIDSLNSTNELAVAISVAIVTFVFARLIFYQKKEKFLRARDECAVNSFKPTKKLSIKDQIVIDMLNLQENSGVCFVVTDPDLPDNPIIYASDGFCNFTGYNKSEIEGRNCRFLQGRETDPNDVGAISLAIKERREINVCILNYRKNGIPFVNQFFLCPIYDPNKKLAYFLGVQVEVAHVGPGQHIENPGYVIIIF